MHILAGYAPHMGVFKTLVLTRKNPFKTRKGHFLVYFTLKGCVIFLYISSAYTNLFCVSTWNCCSFQNKKLKLRLKILLKFPVMCNLLGRKSDLEMTKGMKFDQSKRLND